MMNYRDEKEIENFMLRIGRTMEDVLLAVSDTRSSNIKMAAANALKNDMGMWPQDVAYHKDAKRLEMTVVKDPHNTVTVTRTLDQALLTKDSLRNFGRVIAAVVDDALLETENRTWSVTMRIIEKRLTQRLLKPERVYLTGGAVANVQVPHSSGRLISVSRTLDHAKISRNHFMRYMKMTDEERRQETIALVDGVLLKRSQQALPPKESISERMESIRMEIFERLTSFIPNFIGLHVVTGVNEHGGFVVRVHLTEGDDTITLRRTFSEARGDAQPVTESAAVEKTRPPTYAEVAMVDVVLNHNRLIIDDVEVFTVFRHELHDDKLMLHFHLPAQPDAFGVFLNARKIKVQIFSPTHPVTELFGLLFSVDTLDLTEMVLDSEGPKALTMGVMYNVRKISYLIPKETK